MQHTPGFYLIEKYRVREAYKNTKKRIEIAKAECELTKKTLELIKQSGYNPVAYNKALNKLFAQKDAVSEAFKILEAVRNDFSNAKTGETLSGDVLVDIAEELAYLEINLKQR